jgi:MinD-like ATPase involved in chromosome partitioning or flagellar assembly
MTKIISIHSFRGGTGKSNLVANIAALLAADGQHVGVIDTDVQSPGIHVLFGIEDSGQVQLALNDYLWGNCTMKECTYDVTPADSAGKLFLIPSSIKPGEIARILKEGYEIRRLHEGIRDITQSLNLDVLVIDTHPGLNEETLLSFALSSVVGIVMRPDRQDYQGTGVTVKVARRLKIQRMLLIINKVSPALDSNQIKSEAERIYECEVAAVLPYSEDMMMLASEDIFALRYPDHPFTKALKGVAAALVQ